MVEDVDYWPSESLIKSDCLALAHSIHTKLYEVLGCQFCCEKNRQGMRFSVYAPNSTKVELLLDGKCYGMTPVGCSHVFTVFVAFQQESLPYQYLIYSQDGAKHLKSDPLGFAFEKRPEVRSLTCNYQSLLKRESNYKRTPDSSINIYEVHLGSWARSEGFLNYIELAEKIALYAKDLGYTHIELLPITEHPLDESWGYQVTGYFAPTSRFGSPSEFFSMIQLFHDYGLKVILDWVGGHFPKDDFALKAFDGSMLFEYEDPKKHYHPKWDTLIFDYEKPFVQSFLLSSLHYFATIFHIDGYRFDAVSSIIFHDFEREHFPEHPWVPNRFATAENLEGIAFVKQANAMLHTTFEEIITIAEEATLFPKVTLRRGQFSLGFDYKIALGWTYDLLAFFRSQRTNQELFDALTQYFTYLHDEYYILFLCHDDVAFGRGSLLNKLHGSHDERIDKLKQLYALQMIMPGQKGLFMGLEWGQTQEWDSIKGLLWHEKDSQPHSSVIDFVRQINYLHLNSKQFFSSKEPNVSHDLIRGQKVLVISRHQASESLLLVLNFSSHEQHVLLDKKYSSFEVEITSSDQVVLEHNTAILTPNSCCFLIARKNP